MSLTKKGFIFVLLFLVFLRIGYSQNIEFIPSASSVTTIGSYVAFENPAQLATLESSSVSFLSSPSKFGMSDLNLNELSGVYVSKSSYALGGIVSGFGNSLYNEFTATAAISGNITKSFAIGAAIEADRLSIKNYNNYLAFKYDIGAIVQLTDNISTAVSLNNITGTSFPGGEKSVSSIALFGLGIKTGYDLSFDIDGIININNSSGFAIAGRYDIEQLLSIRLAVRTNPRSAEIGLKFHLIDNFDMLSNLHYHDQLGFSPTIGIVYMLKD